jgi:hypothetical protein
MLLWSNASWAQATATARVLGTGEAVTYQVVNGKALLQGDILLGEHTEVQRNGIRPLTVTNLGSVAMDARSAWAGLTTWPGSVVPYEYNPGLPIDARNAAAEAMRWISSQTAITFVTRTTQTDYVYIISGDGCYSAVGRTGNRQDLSIGPGCGIPGIAAHELLHALGFWHEQSRADRDSYVIVYDGNIKLDQKHNFEKKGMSTLQYGTYDYDSIMHYEYYAFTANGQPTITPRDSRIPMTRLGQRTRLSELDVVALQQAYGGPAKPAATYAELRNGRNLCLTVSSNRALQVAACNGSTGQRWLQDAQARLTPQSVQGYCMSVAANLALQLAPCQNTVDQRWSYESSRFYSQMNRAMVLAESSISSAFVFYVGNDAGQQWRWVK